MTKILHEDLSLLGYDAVSLAVCLPKFRRIVLSSFPEQNCPRTTWDALPPCTCAQNYVLPRHLTMSCRTPLIFWARFFGIGV